MIATSAEEIKDPGRIASVLTPTIFYVLVMLVSTGVLPVGELAASYIPVADVAEQYLGPLGALMMVIGAVILGLIALGVGLGRSPTWPASPTC